MYTPTLADYAYGWLITKAQFGNGVAPVPTIMHGGGINGFNTMIVRFPEQKHLIVMLDNTSQGTSVDRLVSAVTKILFSQPYSLPKMSIVDALFQTIKDKGLEAGLAQYRDLKPRQSGVYDFSEPELNRLGYQLLQTGKLKEAIEIFKLNVAEYPKAFNTYDSLAEAYMISGNTDLAILELQEIAGAEPREQQCDRNVETD